MEINNQIKLNQELVKDFASGNMEAFDLLYHTFNYRLYNFVFGLIKIRTEAEEIAQEVFIKIWESRNQLNKHSSFESFLFTVAYNTTISLFRKKATEKNISTTSNPFRLNQS